MDEPIGPEHPEALFRIGLSLYNQRRHEEALGYFNRAIDGDSTLGEAWAFRGLSRILLRDAKYPLQDLNTALAHLAPPTDEHGRKLRFGVLYARAAGLHHQGKYAEALTDLDGAASLSSLPVQGHLWSGDCHRALGRLQQAAAAYRQAIAEAEPESAFTQDWINAAQALMELGDFAAALEAAQLAIQQAPENALGWTKRAHALLYLARYQECLESVERALTLDSKDFNPWGVKGSALGHLRRYQEAQEAYRRAFTLAPFPEARTVAVQGELRALLHLRRFRAAWRVMMVEVQRQLHERHEAKRNKPT